MLFDRRFPLGGGFICRISARLINPRFGSLTMNMAFHLDHPLLLPNKRPPSHAASWLPSSPPCGLRSEGCRRGVVHRPTCEASPSRPLTPGSSWLSRPLASDARPSHSRPLCVSPSSSSPSPALTSIGRRARQAVTTPKASSGVNRRALEVLKVNQAFFPACPMCIASCTAHVRCFLPDPC